MYLLTSGHSELVTGLGFSNDCRHLISVSGDSCIFVWRLPADMVHTMQVSSIMGRSLQGRPPASPPPSQDTQVAG